MASRALTEQMPPPNVREIKARLKGVSDSLLALAMHAYDNAEGVGGSLCMRAYQDRPVIICLHGK